MMIKMMGVVMVTTLSLSVIAGRSPVSMLVYSKTHPVCIRAANTVNTPGQQLKTLIGDTHPMMQEDLVRCDGDEDRTYLLTNDHITVVMVKGETLHSVYRTLSQNND